MRNNVWVQLLVYVAAGLCMGCQPPQGAPSLASADQTISNPAELLESLRTGDAVAIMNALNSASRLWYAENDTSTLPVLGDLWHRRRDVHPDLSWDLIDLPTIRLTLADQLLQASRNRLTSLSEEEKTEMHSLAQEKLTSGDDVVVKKAARVLGQSNREEDVPVLLALARKTTSRDVFAAAVEAIASICGERASEALDALVGEGPFRDVATRMQSSRSSMTRAWCEAR